MTECVLQPALSGNLAREDDHPILCELEPARAAGLCYAQSWQQLLVGVPKRVLDVVGAAIALVLLAPIMLMAAGLVRLVMGRPAILAHKRVGFDGRIITCYKFRTKLRNDPEVDCLGNILRKSGLNELPQLINVLRGDMSLVGLQRTLDRPGQTR